MKSVKIPLKVIIADGQFLVTESLKSILHKDQRFVVTKVVTEKKELIKELNHENVAILIIDPSLIDISGISELREIKESFPHLKLFVFSNNLCKPELLEFNSIGIKNIILKSACEEEIMESLTAIINGRKYYSGELLDMLFEEGDRVKSAEDPGQLTNSEIEIVRLISEGFTTKEIAAKKFISFHTVISHRKNIFRKLGVTSVSELIMYSIKAGWINTIEYHI